jgi:hypothetical protein
MSALTLPIAMALGLQIENDIATLRCHHDSGRGLCEGRMRLAGTAMGPLPCSGCDRGHDLDEVVEALDERLDWLLARPAVPDPVLMFVERLGMAAHDRGIDRGAFQAAIQEALDAA